MILTPYSKPGWDRSCNHRISSKVTTGIVIVRSSQEEWVEKCKADLSSFYTFIQLPVLWKAQLISISLSVRSSHSSAEVLPALVVGHPARRMIYLIITESLRERLGPNGVFLAIASTNVFSLSTLVHNPGLWTDICLPRVVFLIFP